MDRGACWATVHGVTESDTTEHTNIQLVSQRTAYYGEKPNTHLVSEVLCSSGVRREEKHRKTKAFPTQMYEENMERSRDCLKGLSFLPPQFIC